jgi:pyruvate kinase
MPRRFQIPRRAKIVCTLGPSSNSYEKIKAMAKAGMDVARLNFAHGSHEDHEKVIKIIRKIAKELNKPIAILQDLQGPKIRISKFSEGFIELKRGDIFTLTTRDVQGDNKIVSVSYKSFFKDVKIKDIVLLDDGLLKLKVEKIKGQDVICKVIFGGVLSNHKGLNLPGNILSVSALTDKDKKDIRFGMAQDVDYVALSFVQKPEDIEEIKRIISGAKKDIPVVAKIEKPQAVESIEEIIQKTDVVMVARGDLGVEVSAEEVPPIQKRIIALCNKNGTPVITATQMLESMIHNPRPTRAEASDVANAILDGTDAVMLSGETAAGKFPVTSVQTMHRIVNLIEKNVRSTNWQSRRRDFDQKYSISSSIGFSACQAANLIDAVMIVCLTQSGTTARMISRYRPKQPLIAVTHTERNLRRLNLVWGVRPYSLHEFGDNMDEAITDILNIIKRKSPVKKGDKIVITAGLPFHSRRGTNMLRIEEITD